MFKIVRNTTLLFIFIIGSMTLINWYISQSDWVKPPIQKSLIDNVQANVDITYPNYAIQQDFALYHLKPPKQTLNKNSITLQFKETSFHLDSKERERFLAKLKQLNPNRTSHIEILTGLATEGEDSPLSQKIKVRIQEVARLVYPYTQTIKMHYLPTLELKADTVVVIFSKRSRQ